MNKPNFTLQPSQRQGVKEYLWLGHGSLDEGHWPTLAVGDYEMQVEYEDRKEHVLAFQEGVGFGISQLGCEQ
jgi:hypothetical protein